MATSEGLTGVVNTRGRLTAPVIANDEDLFPREVLEQHPLPALPLDGSIPPHPFSSSEAVAIPIPVTRVARGLHDPLGSHGLPWPLLYRSVAPGRVVRQLRRINVPLRHDHLPYLQWV